MTTRWKLALGGGIAAVALLAFSAGTLFAQNAPAPTHEDMHAMMDVMHGEGFSERMHQAMGEDAEVMMEQCAAMMGMMARMGGMMGQGGMMPGMSGMMGGGSMGEMMRGMQGR